jgi:hypothetical protein
MNKTNPPPLSPLSLSLSHFSLSHPPFFAMSLSFALLLMNSLCLSRPSPDKLSLSPLPRPPPMCLSLYVCVCLAPIYTPPEYIYTYKYTYIYMNTYIRIYIHTYIRIYIHITVSASTRYISALASFSFSFYNILFLFEAEHVGRVSQHPVHKRSGICCLLGRLHRLVLCTLTLRLQSYVMCVYI